MKAPQSELSEARATRQARRLSPCSRVSGEATSTSGSLTRAATISEKRRSYSDSATIEDCTFISLAEATIFIADVIFNVLCTEAIRSFNSFSAAIVPTIL